jgi:hypothetical protein
MSKPHFIPGKASAQRVADQITAAAETAGGTVLNVDVAGEFQTGVFFTQDAWQQFLLLLLDDAFRPKQ